MLTVFTSTNPVTNAARRLTTLLREHKDDDALLLLSGGSAFELLPHVDTTTLSDRVTLSVLDERYTYNEHASNFSQLTQTPFFEHAQKQHVSLIDPRPREEEKLHDTVRRYDLALKHWHITHHNGIVIATMGVGTDGHTSGILPNPENPETFSHLFTDTHTCIRGYHVDPRKNPHPDRMTTTLTYLQRRVQYAVVYAVGDTKRDALMALVAEEGSIEKTPARVLRSMQDVSLYTDQQVRGEKT